MRKVTKSSRQIRIGNQTAFSASSIIEPFRYAVVNGFDAFEWFPDKKESGEGWTEDDIKKNARTLIRRIAAHHDITLSVHASWQANPLKPGAREVLARQIEFAQDMGASLVNIHLCPQEGVEAYVQAIDTLVKRLIKSGIKLAIENTPETGPENFNELFEEIRKLVSKGSDHVGMCLDLGHANLYPQTLNDYIKFIDRLDLQIPIIHVHMHENYGDADTHLPLFTGPAENDPSGIESVLERLSRRRFSGAFILEQWPRPPSLLDIARNRLVEMIKTRF